MVTTTAASSKAERVAVLPFVETFKTLQGEGPAAGQCATFLRFGGCNLSCSWCDSGFTWDAKRFDLREQITALPVQDILDRLPGAPTVVVTGGEPLLNQHNPGWPDLLAGLRTRFKALHLETNGTVAPTAATVEAFDLMNVSPKQAHAGVHRGQQDPTMHPAWAAVPQAVLKIVVLDAGGVLDAVAYGLEQGFALSAIWVMPEGITADVLQQRWPEIAGTAAELGINATHRLHVLAWGETRGH